MNISINLFTKITIKNILFLLLVFISSTATAAIYKWVDENGNVHYGQQRPDNSPAQKMNVQTHAPASAAYKRMDKLKNKNADGEENSEQQADAAPKEPEKKPETKAEKKRRLAACEQAKKNLKTMQAIGRIRSKDKDGNVNYLSQEQKEAKMKQSREMIKKHCK